MKLTEQRMECATCHLVFNGLTNFDKHRTGDDRKCVHPSEVGLIDRGGFWGGQPMTGEQKAQRGWVANEAPDLLAALLASVDRVRAERERNDDHPISATVAHHEGENHERTTPLHRH